MKTVLVIEDNLELRENTTELLELSGYEVFTACDGKIGFEQAKINHPDVIVCDAKMPEVDGLAFLNLIKTENTTYGIPLVFVSAESVPAEVRNGIKQGADVYLSKPFTQEQLLSAIGQFV